MKINKIKINSYGKLKEKEIELKDGINIIYGKNESGKSTLLNFIVNSFYGISKNKKGKEYSSEANNKAQKENKCNNNTKALEEKIKILESKIEAIESELNNKNKYEIYRDFKKKNPKIFNENMEDISKEFNIDKSKGNEFFYEQTKVDEELFLSTVVVGQQEVKLGKQEQNILVQKIANLVGTGDDNVSYKRAIDRINRRLLDEIGTQRSREKPINIINKKIEDLEQKKQELEKYKFDFDKIVDKNVKKRYSSILNPVTLLINGFRKVFDFSILKKILLIGFFISAMFIMYAVSSICATLTIKDADFVQCNSNYLKIKQPNMSVEQYRLLEQNENVNYILPGSSIISFEFNPNDYYQSSRMNIYITGSISSTDMINSENLISGTMPENDRQLVLDKMVIQKQIEQDISLFKMMGILKPEDMIGRTFKLNNVGEFTVVGIVDLLTPSIYASPAMLINIVQNARNSDDNIMDIGTSFVYNDNEETDITQILDYKLFDDKITLEKGRFPENDYEVIVNISHKYDMKLNKTIPVTVNDTKLTVVGYYDRQENIDTYLVNNNTVKYKLIGERKEFMIYTKDKDKVLSDFRSLDLNIIDTYENSKKDFLRQKRESMKTSLIVSAIILAISLVEIFLMIRSSFLSRIKEIGILRAIGIKKMDIYKMFAGETIAITTLASIPGILLMVYILKTLSQMAYFSNFFLVNTWSIIATIIFIYAFNLIVGLLPVHNVVKKTPAQILSRYDI